MMCQTLDQPKCPWTRNLASSHTSEDEKQIGTLEQLRTISVNPELRACNNETNLKCALVLL